MSCFSALAAVWLFYTLERKPDCLGSQTISHFMVHSEESEFIPVCGRAHPRGLKKSQQDLPFRSNLESDLRKFDQLLFGLQSPVRLIRVNLVLTNDYLVQITPDEVWVGRKILFSKGQFLKILNSAWLLQLNPRLLENTVMLETLADLFLAAESGGLALANPNNSKIAEYTGAGELKSYTVLQLCESEWIPTSQIEFCRALTRDTTEQTLFEAKERLAKVQSQFALRPFLGNAMWSRFMRAGVSERFSTLENVANILSRRDFKLESVPEENKDWYDYVNRALKILDLPRQGS